MAPAGAALDLQDRLPLIVDLALGVSESDPCPATASQAHCCWFPSHPIPSGSVSSCQSDEQLLKTTLTTLGLWRPSWSNSMRKRSKTTCMSLVHTGTKCCQQTGGLTKHSCLGLTLFVTTFSFLLAQGFGFTFGETSPAYSQSALSSISRVHDNLASFTLGKCPLH